MNNRNHQPTRPVQQSLGAHRRAPSPGAVRVRQHRAEATAAASLFAPTPNRGNKETKLFFARLAIDPLGSHWVSQGGTDSKAAR